VLASDSAITAIDTIKLYLINNTGNEIQLTGVGTGSSPVQARASAYSALLGNHVANLDSNHSPNPEVTYTGINAGDVLLAIAISIDPNIAEGPLGVTETGPVNGVYTCLLETGLIGHGIGVTLTFDFQWGPPP
jgi:hypothetical protein